MSLFSLLAASGPEDEAPRLRVEARARELGVELPASRRFPVLATKNAAQERALLKLLKTERYRVQQFSGEVIALVAEWVALARSLRPVFKRRGALVLSSAQQKALLALAKRSRASREPALKRAEWSPRLSTMFDVVTERAPLESDEFMATMSLAAQLSIPLKTRLSRVAASSSPEFSELREATCGATDRELVECARQNIQGSTLRKPDYVASFDLRWASFAEGLSATAASAIGELLGERFIALYENRTPGAPRPATIRLQRVWLKKYAQALWGSDDEGGPWLKRQLSRAIKRMRYPGVGIIEAASPY